MTQETTIDVPKAYWWTQNKRGDWRRNTGAPAS